VPRGPGGLFESLRPSPGFVSVRRCDMDPPEKERLLKLAQELKQRDPVHFEKMRALLTRIYKKKLLAMWYLSDRLRQKKGDK